MQQNNTTEFATADEILSSGETIRDEAINKVKECLRKTPMPKSGYNSHHKFKYYELEDILPYVQEACQKHRLTTKYTLIPAGEIVEVPRSRGDHTMIPKMLCTAALEVRSLDYHEPQMFTVPAVIGFDNQSIGEATTYSRRYLLMVAFDITEADTLDRNIGETTQHTTTDKAESYEAEKLPQRKLVQPKEKYAPQERVINKLTDLAGVYGVPVGFSLRL